jgi:hypothetical protein
MNIVNYSKRPPPGPNGSYYAEESSQSLQNENKNQSYTRTTKRISRQWISENESSDITPHEHSYTPLFQRSYYSQSKSPSPNFNTLHRKNELSAPKIKLNLSLAPHLKLRESELRSSLSPSPYQVRRESSILSNNENESVIKRGTSPFTYIETTSIKNKPHVKRRSFNNNARVHSTNSYFSTTENSSSRSTPARDTYKTYLLKPVSTHQVHFLFLN